jgi:hypothetical protein
MRASMPGCDADHRLHHAMQTRKAATATQATCRMHSTWWHYQTRSPAKICIRAIVATDLWAQHGCYRHNAVTHSVLRHPGSTLLLFIMHAQLLSSTQHSCVALRLQTQTIQAWPQPLVPLLACYSSSSAQQPLHTQKMFS